MGKGRDESGPSKNQLRGLSYVDAKPKFLQNAYTALSGQGQSSGRPAIPTRPDEDIDNKLDEADAEEEAPQIVVLNEGKHLTELEAAEAKKNAPKTANTNTAPAKKGASLRFSGTEGKRKIRTTDEDQQGGETFDDLSKRAKIDAGAVKRAQAKPTGDTVPADTSSKKHPLTKEEKAAKKAKRKKDLSMLSFQA